MCGLEGLHIPSVMLPTEATLASFLPGLTRERAYRVNQ